VLVLFSRKVLALEDQFTILLFVLVFGPQAKAKLKSFPSHRAALISVSIALSQGHREFPYRK